MQPEFFRNSFANYSNWINPKSGQFCDPHFKFKKYRNNKLIKFSYEITITLNCVHDLFSKILNTN